MDRAEVERDVAEQCCAAGLRLRRDKVVVRLVDRLGVELDERLPAGEAVIVLLVAPIRSPAKLASVLGPVLRTAPVARDVRCDLLGNAI